MIEDKDLDKKISDSELLNPAVQRTYRHTPGNVVQEMPESKVQRTVGRYPCWGVTLLGVKIWIENPQPSLNPGKKRHFRVSKNTDFQR